VPTEPVRSRDRRGVLPRLLGTRAHGHADELARKIA
jgi:hypothetical protein